MYFLKMQMVKKLIVLRPLLLNIVLKFVHHHFLVLCEYMAHVFLNINEAINK